MLTEYDKRVLNAIQGALPIAERPFAVLAKQLETTEEELLSDLKRLSDDGYIRRFGAFFDSNALGFKGSLVAVKVKEGAMQEVADVINGYNGVTHNYEREGDYNLWFTLQVQSDDERKNILDKVRALPGVLGLMNLPSEKTYKVRVRFNMN
ncbi:siroheme decarboxylase subunit alpha [Schwartzia sp. (in: firmicutes)]